MRLKLGWPKLGKWPFDAGVTIALLALILSLIQLIVTAPLLTSLFMGPKLIVKGEGSDPKSETLFGYYVVVNEGNSAATKIEIGFTLQIDQRLVFMPNLVTKVVEEKDSVWIKNVRIEVERLLPGESFHIMAIPGKGGEKLKPEVGDFLRRSDVREIPVVSFVRSAEGIGKFKPEKLSKR